MNRKKIYLLLTCLGLAFVCNAQAEIEQDTLCPGVIKTFKVKKVESVVVATVPEIAEKEVVVPELEKVDTLTTSDENVQRPSLAYDEKGLLQLVQLAPFSEQATAPKNRKYVIFSFSVNEAGNVNDIRIFDTNDRRLVDILVVKLQGTLWNPAKTNSGDKRVYNFGRWIAAIPSSATENDYERHRY